MPRPLIAILACLAMLLPAAGCYRYDARAKNLTGQEVRVSIHKGTQHREVSTAVLGPGASVGWTGSFNGPVIMRVALGGVAADVPLPRRAHTEVEIAGAAGAWTLVKTVGDESFSIDPRAVVCDEDCELPCCADEEEDAEAGESDFYGMSWEDFVREHGGLDGNDGQETELALSQVPEHMKAAAVAAVPGFVPEEAEAQVKDGEVVVCLEGKADGVGYEVLVSADGTVLETKVDDEADDEGDDEGDEADDDTDDEGDDDDMVELVEPGDG